jgi:bacterioferritin-associated ferredoxin
MNPEERMRARLKPGCICMGIRLYPILEAIEEGAVTFEEIARLTGIGNGDCGGKRCGRKVAEILEAMRVNRR